MFDHIVMTVQTPIGSSVNSSGWRSAACALTAAAVVCADYWLVWTGRTSLTGSRMIPPMVALAAYVVLYRGDLSAMGLRLIPIQGLRYWGTATVLIGAAIGTFLLLAVAAALSIGYQIPLYVVRPEQLGGRFVEMCVIPPIFEEAIYRFGFCTGSVPVLKPWGTIVVSGMTFGALHILYGNPGPDNLIAGYFLAWAYLKSGTVVMPVILHSLGNLCTLVLHFGTWYWHHGVW